MLRARQTHDTDAAAEKVAGPAGIVKRAFGHGPTPEEQLEQVLVERRTELEGYATRFEETARELGRREERLRDERAAVERLLRRSTSELEAREKELVQFERELGARDERLRVAEGELARRRSDLGAVELKRAALEQRERALETREEVVTSREALVNGALSAATSAAAELFFIPGPAYRLATGGEVVVRDDSRVVVDGHVYRVGRTGPSPLPGDERRCAFLVRDPEGAPKGDDGPQS
jgi:hypothetical protein